MIRLGPYSHNWWYDEWNRMERDYWTGEMLSRRWVFIRLIKCKKLRPIKIIPHKCLPKIKKNIKRKYQRFTVFKIPRKTCRKNNIP